MIDLNPAVDWSFSSRLCLALVHSLWQVGALAVGLWLLDRFWKRQSVEVAYACYVVALVVSLAAVPITFARLDVRPSGDFIETLGTVAAVVDAHPIDRAAAAPPMENSRDEGFGDAPAAAQSARQSGTLPRVGAQPFAIDGLRRAWVWFAPLITGLYACGVLLMLVRILKGVWHVQRLRARATLIEEGPLAAVLESLAAGWRLRVVPALARVEGTAVPKVIGLLRPTILLPVAAVSGVPAHELEMILAHELAHVRRYDMWVNLLQRLTEALLFFNPGLWFLSRRISSLREFCCDELTCRTLSEEIAQPRVRYAQALVHVAELAHDKGRIDRSERLSEVAALAASGRSPSELRRRVARLLGEPLREPLQLSRGGVLLLTAIVFLFLLAPAISFSSNEQDALLAVDNRDEESPAAAPIENRPADHRAANPDEASQEKAFISGRIVLEDGSPAKTKGWLYSDLKMASGNTAHSTEDQYTDRFAIRIAPGTVWLKYFPRGFAPTSIGPLELAPGQRLENVKLVLRPGTPLRVQIQGERGEPIPSATVVPLPVAGGDASGPYLPETADDRGRVLLEHMGEMPYQFNVTAPGYQPLRTGHLEVATKKQLELVMMRSEPTTGVVLDAQGQPAAGAVLRLEAALTPGPVVFGVGTVMATTDEQGRFTLDQLASDWHCLFLIETVDKARLLVPSITAGQSDLEIRVPPRRDLRLRLIGDISTLPKRKGMPFVKIQQRYLFRPGPNFTNWDDLISEDVFVTPTDEGGLVEYQGLIEGKVEITAGKQTETVESQEGLTEVVVQLPAKLPKPAADEQTVIRGRVQDEQGNPIAGADVGLMVYSRDVDERASQSRPFAVATQTDEAGNFGLPIRGELRKQQGSVWAHAKGYGPLRLRHTRLPARFAIRAPIVFTLEPAERTEFKLLDVRNEPVANATLRVLKVKVKESIGWPIPVDWADRFRATTGEDGVAVISSFVPAALQRLRVDAETSGRVEFDQNYFLNLPPNGPPHFVLQMPDAGHVEGEVPTDQADAPRQVHVQLKTRCRPSVGPMLGVWGIADTATDESGRFVVPRIAAGQLDAQIMLPVNGPWRASVPSGLTVAAGETTDLVIPLERGVLVRGLIRKQDAGEGYAGFSLSVIYGPSAQRQANLYRSVKVETDKDGRFSAFVPPGPIELRLHSAPRDYRHVEWWGSRKGRRREVPAGVAEFELDPIDLAPTEFIEGQLLDQDGNPLGDWSVYGFPEVTKKGKGGLPVIGRATMNSFGGVRTDRDGRFSGYFPKPYRPRYWGVARVTGAKTYQTREKKYEPTIISDDPFVLQVEVEDAAP